MWDIPLAFLGGIAGFFSPCFLPLVPGYIALLSGISYDDMSSSRSAAGAKYKFFFWTCFFCAGMLTIFVLMGLLVVRLQGFFPLALLTTLSGIFFIAMGLWMLINVGPSWLPSWPSLQKSNAYAPYERALLCFCAGGIFAMSWIPCTGPILAVILVRVAHENSLGTILMIAYALGRSIPFLLASLFLPQMKRLFRNKKWTHYVQIFMGLSLILFGIFMLSGYTSALLSFSFF